MEVAEDAAVLVAVQVVVLLVRKVDGLPAVDAAPADTRNFLVVGVAVSFAPVEIPDRSFAAALVVDFEIDFADCYPVCLCS